MGKVVQLGARTDEDSARPEAAVHGHDRSSDGFASPEKSGIHPRVPTYLTFARWPLLPPAIDARLVQRAVELTKLTLDYESTARLERVKVWLRQALQSGEPLDENLLVAARAVFGPRLEGLGGD